MLRLVFEAVMVIAVVWCLYFMMKLGEMDNKPDVPPLGTEDNPDHEQSLNFSGAKKIGILRSEPPAVSLFCNRCC